MVAVTYSQFFSWLWGFEKTGQRASRVMVGLLLLGCCYVFAVIALAVFWGGGVFQMDPHPWEWLDVVSTLIRLAIEE